MRKLHLVLVFFIAIVLVGCQIERLELDNYHDVLVEAGFTTEEVDTSSEVFEELRTIYGDADRFISYMILDNLEAISQGGIVVYKNNDDAKNAIDLVEEELNNEAVEDFRIKVIGNFLFVGDSYFFETLGL